jgi:hypothetical protein
MKKNFLKINIVLSLLAFLILPYMALAAPSATSTAPGDLSSQGGGLVPDCPATGCGWPELIKLVSKVINFLVFDLSLPIAAIVFAYAGFRIMTRGDNPGNRAKAIGMFKKVGLGLVIAMTAWLIIHTILATLNVKTGYSLLEGGL